MDCVGVNEGLGVVEAEPVMVGVGLAVSSTSRKLNLGLLFWGFPYTFLKPLLAPNTETLKVTKTKTRTTHFIPL